VPGCVLPTGFFHHTQNAKRAVGKIQRFLGVYQPTSIADWTDAELLELWLERVAIRLMPVEHRVTTLGEVRQAEYLAAKEVQRWVGGRHLPDEIRVALRKFR